MLIADDFPESGSRRVRVGISLKTDPCTFDSESVVHVDDGQHVHHLTTALRFDRNLKRSGLTVIELMVCVSIIAVLASLLLPAVNAARESSRAISCKDKQRQTGMAIISYEAKFKYYPIRRGVRSQTFFHWHREILPEIEQSELFERIQYDISNGLDWHQLSGMRVRINLFECPSDPMTRSLVRNQVSGILFGATNYVGIVGQSLALDDGFFPGKFGRPGITEPRRAKEIVDGLSNTFCLGERPLAEMTLVGAWQSGQDYGHESLGLFEQLDWRGIRQEFGICEIPFGPGKVETFCDQFHPWSQHGSGANFTKGDGSVHWVPYATDEKVLRSMCTRDGGEVSQLNDF
jgi:prepilin-type N-terminal cleavage/methylation domain-containing protein